MNPELPPNDSVLTVTNTESALPEAVNGDDVQTNIGARFTFPNGTETTLHPAVGTKLSGRAIAEFGRICFKPAPIAIEILDYAIPDNIILGEN